MKNWLKRLFGVDEEIQAIRKKAKEEERKVYVEEFEKVEMERARERAIAKANKKPLNLDGLKEALGNASENMGKSGWKLPGSKDIDRVLGLK